MKIEVLLFVFRDARSKLNTVPASKHLRQLHLMIEIFDIHQPHNQTEISNVATHVLTNALPTPSPRIAVLLFSQTSRKMAGNTFQSNTLLTKKIADRREPWDQLKSYT